MNKTDFVKIFEQAMSETTTMYQSDDNGVVYSEVIDIPARLVIRDFEIEGYPECDEEFTDVEAAWNHFQNLSKCRLMANNGIIYFDNY